MYLAVVLLMAMLQIGEILGVHLHRGKKLAAQRWQHVPSRTLSSRLAQPVGTYLDPKPAATEHEYKNFSFKLLKSNGASKER